MPLYYFDADDRLGEIRDQTGVELDSQAAAYRYAIESIRAIVADDVRRGMLDLQGTLQVRDASGNELFDISYEEAIATAQEPGLSINPLGEAVPGASSTLH